MQIKTRRGHSFTPVRLAIIKETTNNKCWQICEEKGTLVYVLLLGFQIGTAMVENSLDIPPKLKIK